MTRDELAACLLRLSSAYPGEWDEGRVTVWADHLGPLEFARVNDALRQMEANAEFPSVAAFYAAFSGRQPEGAQVRDGHVWLPGSGWLGDGPDDAPLELEPVADHDAAIASIAEARARLRKPRGEAV